MGRLTDKYSDGTPFVPERVLQLTNGMQSVIKKLAHYEDMEEQGRLIEQKHGQWEECDWVFYDGHDECVHIPKGAFVCTNCRHAFKKGKLEIRNYCPHCGAKMELKELEGDKE